MSCKIEYMLHSIGGIVKYSCTMHIGQYSLVCISGALFALFLFRFSLLDAQLEHLDLALQSGLLLEEMLLLVLEDGYLVRRCRLAKLLDSLE